jgi:hypothetical protein
MVTIPHPRFEIPHELPGLCSVEKLTQDNQKHTALVIYRIRVIIGPPP